MDTMFRRGEDSAKQCTNHSVWKLTSHSGASFFIQSKRGDLLHKWPHRAINFITNKNAVYWIDDFISLLYQRKIIFAGLTCFSANSRAKCFTKSLDDCCPYNARLIRGLTWALPCTSTWKDNILIWAEQKIYKNRCLKCGKYSSVTIVTLWFSGSASNARRRRRIF